MNKKYFYIILDNLKTIFYALIIAVLIRSLFFQPFYIPSSSMEPTLLIGDRIFVSKYTYGYSRHSFPFSLKIFRDRILFKEPKRGDLVVFKTPADNRTDYIKRLIGMPGDKIQFIDGKIKLNNEFISRKKINSKNLLIRCGSSNLDADIFEEFLPNGVSYKAVYKKTGTLMNTDLYIVPKEHYFFLGDNRDCSKDSRYLTSVGYVHKNNLVGKAQFLFFSSDFRIGSIFKFWKWDKTIRINRFFKKIN